MNTTLKINALNDQMSQKFNQDKYNELVDEFLKANKRVRIYKTAKRELSKNPDTLLNYKTTLVVTYNDLIQYITHFYDKFSEESQQQLRERIESSKQKVIDCFLILNLDYNWSENLFVLIDIAQVNEKPTAQAVSSGVTVEEDNIVQADTESGEEEKGDEHSTHEQLNVSDNLTFEDSVDTQVHGETSNGINPPVNNTDNFGNTETMVQSTSEFLKLAASIINYKFAGDPLKLQSFLTDIELVSGLAEDANTDLCLKFIKSKVEGKALECLPDNVTTIEHITDALKAEIKPENSSIIEGKMSALRLEKGNFSKFSEQAEKLAEALRRTLIVEGISKAKAQEMTINKTVEICRKTARSEVVKSVLASKAFESPAEVIAKFVTENTIARKEFREASSFKGKKFPPNNNGNQNKRFDNRSNNDNRNNSGRYNSNNRQNDNQNRNNNNRPNNFQHTRRFTNSNRHQNNQNNRQHNARNNNANEHTIRIVSGNQAGPSSDGPVRNDVYHVPMN